MLKMIYYPNLCCISQLIKLKGWPNFHYKCQTQSIVNRHHIKSQVPPLGQTLHCLSKMDSKKSTSLVVFLSINLLFFVLVSGCNTPMPNPNPYPPPTPSKGSCPRDALKLGVCAKLLNGSIGTVIGNPPDHPCCSILGGLIDLEAAICLCTALKANILGININIPISLSVLINTCGKKLPSDFICA